MKTIITSILLLAFTTQLQAKIFYLNNNITSPNPAQNLYDKWSDVYAAASSGDTIYVNGSATNYGDIDFEKKLTVIGTGYFLSTNANTQANKLRADFNRINFLAGSEESTIIGLTSDVTNGNSVITIQTNKITLVSCYFRTRIIIYNSTNKNIDDITIQKCYLNGGVDNYNMNYQGVYNNLTLMNNVINGSIELENGSSGIVANNLFLHNYLKIGSSSSFEITNNIWINTNTNDFTIIPLPDASVHHNFSVTGAFGNANGNIQGPQSTVFVGSGTTDGQYMLAATSPCKGTGKDGIDMGPFGGPSPYVLSGLPPLPNIYELSTGGFVTGDTLTVSIKIKQ